MVIMISGPRAEIIEMIADDETGIVLVEAMVPMKPPLANNTGEG